MQNADLVAHRAMASVAEVGSLIKAGHILILAGAEDDLAKLPPGNWIGGTAAGFLIRDGLAETAGQLIYADLSPIATRTVLRVVSARQLRNLSQFYPENGFAMIIMPGQSDLLRAIATRMPDWPSLYNTPLVGWVSGVPLSEIGRRQPSIFCGTGKPRHDRAAIMYVSLPENMFAELNVVNPFSVASCTAIRFFEKGYDIRDLCQLNGQRVRLNQLISTGKIDPTLPLLADKDGALLNNSIIAHDPEAGRVTFLNPVDPALTYRFAELPVSFSDSFAKASEGINPATATLSSICVAGLRHFDETMRHRLPAIAPVTFGQIGYTLLTQTIACLNLSCIGTFP